jgi:CheY-like chemotaxis protein
MRALIPTTIDLRPDITATADIVLADPAQIQQVVINLVMNAAQAMEHAGGIIEVRLVDMALDEVAAQRHDLKAGTYVQLTVRDTGGGIEPTIMAKIFDPYFTTKEVGKGTGMGLAVVHGIVKHHGGAISAQSAVGQGTSFQVHLPVQEAETVLPSPPTIPLSSGQERIVFIDDEQAISNMGQELLSAWARWSRNAAASASMAPYDNQPLHLVITDMTMPGMTGRRR